MSRARRGGLFAITTAAVALATVNPAAAIHSSTAGKMVIEGSSGGSSTSIGSGDAYAPGTFCPGSPTGGATAPTSGGSVIVTVSPSGGGGCPGSKLTSGTYNVHFRNGPAWTVQNGQYTSTGAGTLYLLGTLTVSGGKGSGSYSLPDNLTPNGANDASAIYLGLAAEPPNPNKVGVWTDNRGPIAIV